MQSSRDKKQKMFAISVYVCKLACVQAKNCFRGRKEINGPTQALYTYLSVFNKLHKQIGHLKTSPTQI